ncbi:MAG: hypothetical protein NWF05_03355 [Candidatus Bathyarchaeota archaeon]|nr:hypothetical protein [Candidatus Bathyarchaeota archaeon]
MQTKFNWIALAGGVATLLLIVVSLFVPWWRFTVGNPAIAEASFSPVNLNFSLLGSPLSIPLIWAMNVAAMLSLATGGIILLIYAVMPAKPYSKRLLGFGYNKPLFAVVLFVVELVVLVVFAKTLVGFDVPLMGAANIQIPQNIIGDLSIGIGVTSAFEWPFYFAIVVAVLCVAAKLYHGKTVPDISG